MKEKRTKKENFIKKKRLRKKVRKYLNLRPRKKLRSAMF